MKKAPGQVLISQAHIHFLLGCKLDLPEADTVEFAPQQKMDMGL